MSAFQADDPSSILGMRICIYDATPGVRRVVGESQNGQLKKRKDDRVVKVGDLRSPGDNPRGFDPHSLHFLLV